MVLFTQRLLKIIKSPDFSQYVQTNEDLIYILEGAFLSLFIFLLYIEFSPGMGGILFRPWSDGKMHFNPLGALPMFQYPFREVHFWKPENWDLNFIIFTALGTLIYYTFRKYLKLLAEIQQLSQEMNS